MCVYIHTYTHAHYLDFDLSGNDVLKGSTDGVGRGFVPAA
jgi:hypothetical protein